MSLMKTLARVAIGVAVAKGVSGMMHSRSAPGAGTRQAGAPGGLGDMMNEILGKRSSGSSATGGQSSGGLGGLLGQLSGGKGGSSSGGLDSVLKQLGQGGSAGGSASGGLGGLLGGLLGGAAAGTVATGARPAGSPQRGFGDLFNEALQGHGELTTEPTPTQEAAAGLMLRAMIQAAKADGVVDEGERAKLLDALKDGGEAELQFVKDELAAPVDIEGLARQVPQGLEAQVYLMSLMAITLDSPKEAQYLDRLATAMGLSRDEVNGIHAQAGVADLYI